MQIKIKCLFLLNEKNINNIFTFFTDLALMILNLIESSKDLEALGV